jgi:folate-binding protein YgfZ
MGVTALTEKLSASARRGEYRGAETVAAYSDPKTEFFALRTGCGVYDLGWRAKIKLTGRDRVRWLNGMITNNIRDLAAGGGVYAFLLNPQGRILGDLYAYNCGEYLIVDTDQAQAENLLKILGRYIIMDDVKMEDISTELTAIGLAGPKAEAVLQKAGLESPQVAPLRMADLTWQNLGLTLVGGEDERRQSYEIWLSPGSVDQVWEALVQVGATPVGSEALELYRVARGVPRYGQDIRERDLPQETEQMRALNFTKGCYIGQEIVERIRSRGNVHRKFTGFAVDGALPAPGSKISVDGKEVGEITSVASLPTDHGERGVALGYIRREVAVPGKTVQVGETKAAVTELPFAD